MRLDVSRTMKPIWLNGNSFLLSVVPKCNRHCNRRLLEDKYRMLDLIAKLLSEGVCGRHARFVCLICNTLRR